MQQGGLMRVFRSSKARLDRCAPGLNESGRAYPKFVRGTVACHRRDDATRCTSGSWTARLVDAAVLIVGAFAASNCVAHETFRKHDYRFFH